jgi:hypothetical protein
VSTWSQKGCWLVHVVGIYTFNSEVSHNSNHLIFRNRALPGYSSCIVHSFGFSTSLFLVLIFGCSYFRKDEHHGLFVVSYLADHFKDLQFI